jgi:hypothetical protein
LLLLLFFACSFAGGWLITAGAFNLRRSEIPLAGFATGMIVSTWLANVLGHFLPVAQAFWIASALTVALGLAFFLPFRISQPAALASLGTSLRRLPWGQFAAFLIITYIYFVIGRGLAIFDDYQNLPQVSLLATGDIPPHFALDPSVNFGYHHLLLLFAAQIMRLGDVFPWTALDLARAIVFALALILAYLWGTRFTRNRVAGFLTAVFVALSGGTRWLLLFVPQRFAPGFVANIHLIGSGNATAPDLMSALLKPWAIDGAGPLPFPFAFANGIYTPAVLALGGIGAMGILLLVLLLLTAGRWKGWRGVAVTVIFFAALALLLEAEFLLTYVALGLAVIIIWSRARRIDFGDRLGQWLAVGLFAGVIALFQGGVLTSLAGGFAGGLLHPQGGGTSYFSFGFSPSWPPSLISAHLGELSLANPYQLVTLLAEVGPIILVFPLVVVWGWKSLRARRWFDAAFAFLSVLSLLVSVVHYSGTAGISATGRLYAPFFKVSMICAVPLVWVWARHRSDTVKIASLSLGGLTLVSGIVMLAFEMVAIPKPVYSYYLYGLDVQVMRDYYDRLEPDALIFDPVQSRAPAILGRFTDSALSWYSAKPGWLALVAAPDPFALRAAGFDYALIDRPYWEGLSETARTSLQNACVRQVFDYQGLRNPPDDYHKDFRRLLDLRQCQ